MNIKNSVQQGFSLIEMAVVLVIVGLLIGGGFSTLGPYLDNAKQSHTLSSLELTKQALLNYVTVNKHMPCPDTNGDGTVTDPADRAGTLCNAYFGTVPYDDLGLGRTLASDDWGNVFSYGVHQQAASAAVMVSLAAGSSALADKAGSYFYNQSAPDFDLNTPPTATEADSATESFTICKRTAADNCTGSSDKEMEFIPAVIVAFNENGSGTNLTGCGTASRGARETENCDADMTLIKGIFREGEYDDQMVAISAYEIKQHALDIDASTSMSLTPNPGEYDGYDVIIKGDVDSANATNLGTGDDEAFYIDTTDGDDTTGGNLDAQVTLKDGADKLYVTNDILSGGNADMGAGDDELFVGGNVAAGGNAALGTGNDVLIIEGGILYKGSVDLEGDNDIATIGGSVGGTLDAGTGDDTVTVIGDVTGSVNMEGNDDTLYVTGDVVGGDLDGGTGTDTLYVSASEGEFATLLSTEGGSVQNFENIVYGYAP